VSATLDVVIPLFNGVATLERAVNSVLRQDVDLALRIFIVDDCSADESWLLACKLADSDERITTTRHSRNLGTSAARNTGVRLGCGELIGFIDQDDEWMPGKVARQAPPLLEPLSSEYSTGEQYIMLESGHKRPSWCRDEWLNKPLIGYVPSALMVKRETWNLVGAFDERFRSGGDDTEWFLRLRKFGLKHHFVNQVVVRRYVHENNNSANISASNRELLEVVRQWLPSQSDD
jgi:glycosyltransferase involved in cell wall biosynthesis